MNEKLMDHLRGFENHYPYKLEEKFARIADRISELWYTAQIDGYFSELLIDARGNRAGFPPEIAREIFLLSITHEEIRNTRQAETDVWAAEREAAQRAIDELNLKFLPSHMLKAAESSDASLVELFIKAGMAVDVRDEREWTPLMVAAFNGHEDVARMLINHGANVHARDVGGYTPLHWAALNGFESVIRLLISKGIERNSRSNFGWTALMQAATKGHIKVVRALLDAGDDPKIATDDGWTALHKAVANHHIETVGLLLSAGASALARHQDGSTPLSLAQASKDEKLINDLRNAIKAGMTENTTSEKQLIIKSAERESLFNKASLPCLQ
jgi:ankyrin repeat protein